MITAAAFAIPLASMEFWTARLHNAKMDFTELPGTPGLLLVAVLG